MADGAAILKLPSVWRSLVFANGAATVSASTANVSANALEFIQKGSCH